MDKPDILALEIGNAETALGQFRDGKLLASWRVSAHAGITPDEAQGSLQAFLDAKGLAAPGDAIVCSVVPALTSAWVDALHAMCGRLPLVVGPGLKSGIAMSYKDPGQVGGDRVVCAVAAKARYGASVTVVDFGVATSITIVDEKGALLGGCIALGIQATMQALGALSAQLIETDLRVPKQVIGRSTADAIRSGVVLGEAKKVDGLIEAIWEELGYRTALVATGRYAQVVCGLSRHDFEICDDLALYGLYDVYALNRRDDAEAARKARRQARES